MSQLALQRRVLPYRKVVAFSLYGHEPRYLVGAVRNTEQVPRFYPGWEVHFWVGPDVDPDVTEKLLTLGGFVHLPPGGIKNGMTWRFLAHDLPGVERYVCRDVDSRPSEREARAVQEWVESGRQLHIMRDHPYHNQAIMGGMWGWRKGPSDCPMEQDLKFYNPGKAWGEDFKFLQRTISEQVVSILVHDSCGAFDGDDNWPNTGPSFVGEYIDEHEQPNEEHRKIRLEWLSRP